MTGFDEEDRRMSTSLTSARQRNAISEGMALGLLLCGRSSVPHEKVRVDLAFEGAWRGWSYTSQSPQVSTDLRKGLDAIWVMTRADKQKKVWVLYWETGADLLVRARQPDWDVTDPNDVAFAIDTIGANVPAEGWKDLAADFIQRFEQ